MGKHHSKQEGFGVVSILSIIALLVLIIGAGWYVYQKDRKTSPISVTATTTSKKRATASNNSNTAEKGSDTTTNTPSPVLGQLWGPPDTGQQGYGTVKPQIINNGGDPTGIVTNITWQSWGGTQATGTGMTDYVMGNEDVADGTTEQATVVAFNLGMCQGKPSYNAVEWYFPQYGQTFNPSQYRNICTGKVVGS